MWRPLLHQCDNCINLRISLHDHMDGNRMQLPGSGWGSPRGLQQLTACTAAAVHVLPSLEVESCTGATTLSLLAQSKDHAVRQLLRLCYNGGVYEIDRRLSAVSMWGGESTLRT